MSGTVLLVHDDIAVIAPAKRVLQREGVDSVLVTNAADAIIAFGDLAPAVVVLAPEVDGGRGAAIYQEIRGHPQGGETRFVLLGSGLPEAPEAVIVDLPLDGQALMAAVERALEGDEAASAWHLTEPSDPPAAVPEPSRPLEETLFSDLSNGVLKDEGTTQLSESLFADLPAPDEGEASIPPERLAEQVIAEAASAEPDAQLLASTALGAEPGPAAPSDARLPHEDPLFAELLDSSTPELVITPASTIRAPSAGEAPELDWEEAERRARAAGRLAAERAVREAELAAEEELQQGREEAETTESPAPFHAEPEEAELAGMMQVGEEAGCEQSAAEQRALLAELKRAEEEAERVAEEERAQSEIQVAQEAGQREESEPDRLSDEERALLLELKRAEEEASRVA
ncbi:MAG: hypothetical protein HY901_14220, partial [Deltaproteobacteria bacterium]|nr:hypothetical protein [Deltaproteobacteria bacterium]